MTDEMYMRRALELARQARAREEVPVGAGEVDWPAFMRTLDKLRFRGNLAIEREYGTERVADIRTARELVEKTYI